MLCFSPAFPKLFWDELIKALLALIKLFVFAKRSLPAHCCLLMSSCVTAPCLLIEGEMKAEKWKKNDPMVTDFLTGSAEAVVHVAESRQFGLANRQLCGCSEGSCGGYRQHRFLSIERHWDLRRNWAMLLHVGVLFIRIIQLEVRKSILVEAILKIFLFTAEHSCPISLKSALNFLLL